LLAPGLFFFALFASYALPERLFTKPISFALNMPRRIFLLLVLLVSTAVTGATAVFVFEGIPHIQDSIAQFFQARIFASGRIVLAAPELGQFFDVQYIMNDGKIWHGKYLFGQSLLLTLGVILKSPWIVNPVLSGISLVVIYYFAKEMFDEQISRLSVLLCLASPFYVFMCSSYMSHVPNLLFITLCLLCTLRSHRTKKWYYPFLSGLLFGLAFNTRSLSAVAIAAPFFAYSIFVQRKRLVQAKQVILFCLPALALLCCFLLYNYTLTGDFFTTGYAKYDPRHGLGFGPDKGELTFRADGTFPGHTPRKGIRNTVVYLVALSTDLFGWPSLSFLFILILFASLTRSKWDYLLLSSIVLSFLGYFFYWGLGICLGARFFFECIPMFLMLTARGILLTPQILAKYSVTGKSLRPGVAQRAVGVFVLSLCTINIFLYLPSRVFLYGDSYWNVNADIQNQVKRRGITNALVFVESQHYRKPHTGIDYYNAAFIYNSLDLDGDVVYARDLGEAENIKLMAYHPSRTYYLFKETGRAKGFLVELEKKAP
jgi:hypothetical protein